MNVYAISPLAPDNSNTIAQIPIPVGNETLYAALLSPDGQWLALPFVTAARDQMTLQVAHLSSDMVDTVASGPLSFNVSPVKEGVMRWSPNGEYLAFIIGGEIQVFDPVTQTVRKLPPSQGVPQQIAWSNQSDQLLVLTRQAVNTPSGVSYTAALMTFELTTGLVQQEFNLNDIPSLYLPLCNVSWSPDDAYISWQSACETDAPYVPKEIFAWDIAEGRIFPITDYTTKLSERPGDTISQARYSTLWYDPQTLLIGAAVQIAENDALTETIAYDLKTGESRSLSSQTTTTWITHPTLDLLALVTNASATDAPIIGVTTLSTLELDSQNSRDGFDFVTASPPSADCDLSWSPTDPVLVYAQHDNGDCRGRVEALTFVDVRAGTLRARAFSETDEHIIPLGWIPSEE